VAAPYGVKRSAKLAVAVLCFGYDKVWTAIRRVLRVRHAASFVVLYYHDVSEAERAKFARQMDNLVRVCRVVPAGWDGDGSPGSRLVAVTFDDACATIVRTAVPELQARGIPFSVFVPSAMIGCERTWDLEGACPSRVMTESQVRWLSQLELATVGSHTVHHVDLRSVSNEVVQREMTYSKAALEAIA
jgi:hypothetical protein